MMALWKKDACVAAAKRRNIDLLLHDERRQPPTTGADGVFFTSAQSHS